ncbi:MAG: hypothetical protein HY901_34880 [Deltaproteobacteria bacterium]|nr:hypothetical protein [Deltaproteobacteria bacterium]
MPITRTTTNPQPSATRVDTPELVPSAPAQTGDQAAAPLPPADTFEAVRAAGSKKAKALDPQKMAREVLAKLPLTPDPYTRYEEKAARRVGELCERLALASAGAGVEGGPVEELRKRFPAAAVDVAMAASVFEHESIQYLVTEKGARNPRHFVVTPAGKLLEDREASNAILGKVRLKDGKSTFSPVTYKQRIPVFEAPPLAPGREVDVSSGSRVRSGTLIGVNGDGKWTLELTTASGKKTRKTLDSHEVVMFNTSHEFSLHGATYSEVSLDVGKDPQLKKFLDEASAIARPILDGAGPDLASRVEAQKRAIEALMHHVEANLEYPSSAQWGEGDIPSSDPRSIRFNELEASVEGSFGGTFPFGELLSIRAGECRHRAIGMQMCLQVAGIDSRLTSGGAYTAGGVYRGPHAWLETTLADGSRFLTDAQWGDAFLPLRETYEQDARRQEIPEKTEHYDAHLIY